MNTPTKIIVHHTGGVQGNPHASTRHHTAETVNRHHMTLWPRFISKLGWHVGYHYIIEATGKTVQCRGTSEEGAHTIGMNKSSIGVCLTGNFDTEFPTRKQQDAFVKLFKGIKKDYPHITVYDIEPHRKYARKSCFGTQLPDDYFQKIVTADLPQKDKLAEKVQHEERAKMLTLIETLRQLIALLSAQLARKYE